MKPLQTITKAASLAGLALTGYAYVFDTFGMLETFPLVVFFFWAHVYAHHEINL